MQIVHPPSFFRRGMSCKVIKCSLLERHQHIEMVAPVGAVDVRFAGPDVGEGAADDGAVVGDVVGQDMPDALLQGLVFHVLIHDVGLLVRVAAGLGRDEAVVRVPGRVDVVVADLLCRELAHDFRERDERENHDGRADLVLGVVLRGLRAVAGDGEIVDVRGAVDEVVDLGGDIDPQVVEHVVARFDDVADAQELLRAQDVLVVRLSGRDRQMVLLHVVVIELVGRRVAEDREHAEDTGGQDFHHRLERVDERGAVMGRRDGRDGGDHVAVAALEQGR